MKEAVGGSSVEGSYLKDGVVELAFHQSKILVAGNCDASKGFGKGFGKGFRKGCRNGSRKVKVGLFMH